MTESCLPGHFGSELGRTRGRAVCSHSGFLTSPHEEPSAWTILAGAAWRWAGCSSWGDFPWAAGCTAAVFPEHHGPHPVSSRLRLGPPVPPSGRRCPSATALCSVTGPRASCLLGNWPIRVLLVPEHTNQLSAPPGFTAAGQTARLSRKSPSVAVVWSSGAPGQLWAWNSGTSSSSQVGPQDADTEGGCATGGADWYTLPKAVSVQPGGQVQVGDHHAVPGLHVCSLGVADQRGVRHPWGSLLYPEATRTCWPAASLGPFFSGWLVIPCSSVNLYTTSEFG